RDVDLPGFTQLQTTEYLLTHMDDVRQTYNENTAGPVIVSYYNRPLGLLTRLEVFSGDDAIIHLTDREGPFGYQPIVEGFVNLIPHFIYRDKPKIGYGNVYAHE